MTSLLSNISEKYGCKQAIRGKPIRFGYKWCQATTAGYLINFDLYQGKTFNGNERLETEFGKCSATILHLLNGYSDEKRCLPYTIYRDNLFTSIPLLFELKKHGENYRNGI